MKTKDISLTIWGSFVVALAAMLTWAVFDRVAAASHSPGFPRVLWVLPLVVLPANLLVASIVLWREKSHRVRLCTLRWFALLLPSVAAPIVFNEAQIGLAGNLAVNAVSLAIQLVGSFWYPRRLRLIREAIPDNGHGAEHIR